MEVFIVSMQELLDVISLQANLDEMNYSSPTLQYVK